MGMDLRYELPIYDCTTERAFVAKCRTFFVTGRTEYFDWFWTLVGL